MQTTVPHHHLILELQAGLPPIRADRERLSQVLTNLLSNAIKYSPENSDVVISSLEDNDWLRISVQDWGFGMSPDTQKKLFSRFYRAQDELVRAAQGLGLGLYISAEIIRQHGGEITFTSELGKGSVFTVNLPLKA